MPLISVLMPVYNAEKYLALAIESILKQTFKDFEFLIFNDGSSDKSKDIIQSFTDPRIKLIDSVTNMGLVARLNQGLEIATGKYIARMDADDISLPERFEMQIDFLESHPEVGLCGAWIREFSNSVETSDQFLNSHIYRHEANHEEICVNLLRFNSFAHPVVMMRRDIFIDHGLRYEQEYFPSEDYRLWIRLREYTRFHNIQKVLLHYRKHSNQVSTQKFKSRKSNRIKIELIEQLLGSLTEKEAAIYNDILNKTYSSSSRYLSDLYTLINKIISTNKIKKYYKHDLLDTCFQNVFKSVSKVCVRKNRGVIFLWMKMYPQKKSLQYYTYTIYLLFSSFKTP